MKFVTRPVCVFHLVVRRADDCIACHRLDQDARFAVHHVLLKDIGEKCPHQGADVVLIEHGDNLRGSLAALSKTRTLPEAAALPIVLLATKQLPERTQVACIESGANLIFCAPICNAALESTLYALGHLQHGYRQASDCPDRANLLLDESRHNQIEKELLQAVRYRDEFFSMASHELNTPVTALLLNLQLLQKRFGRRTIEWAGAAAIMDGLTAAVHQVQRLSTMLDKLFDVSRMHTQQIHLELCAIDLWAVLSEVVARLDGYAKSKNTRFSVAEHDNVVIGYWDRMRIEQIITNLLTNAAKYGLGKPIFIDVTSDAASATIRVQDFGIGIDVADQRRIFGRFERASSAAQAESRGLGLYITKEIVQAHGGTVSVSSCLGQGSVFTVTLPLRHLARSGESNTSHAV